MDTHPLLYPTLFVLGMVGYSKLETRREVALAKYLFKILRGHTDNPRILEWLRLCVPDNCAARRRRPQLLALPRARTNLLREAPLTRALRTLNAVSTRIDLFSCSLIEFTKVVTHVVCYNWLTELIYLCLLYFIINYDLNVFIFNFNFVFIITYYLIFIILTFSLILINYCFEFFFVLIYFINFITISLLLDDFVIIGLL